LWMEMAIPWVTFAISLIKPLSVPLPIPNEKIRWRWLFRSQISMTASLFET
jgi:hypothetical protein